MPIWFIYYNVCRVHHTLRGTPAMESGISNHVWTIEELCALLLKLASSSRLGEKQMILTAIERGS